MADVKLIIFDLDGTLLNTLGDLARGVNRTLSAHGLPEHEVAEYKNFVGRGMRNLVRDALPAEKRGDDAFVDGFLKEFLEYYLAHIDVETVPYPGVVELLGYLSSRGIKLAVASNKIQGGTEHLIDEFFPGIPFAAVCGNAPGFPLKPDAALVEHIIEKAGVTKSETIMVGDSDTDIRTARNAGIPVIAVSWGFRPLADLAGADRIVGDVAGLVAAVFSA